jgi:2-polyprenyl-6-methoxyphenol hydroxylase-like FAD-dependent oxidoreductase
MALDHQPHDVHPAGNRVLIIGGNFAGLALAIALRRVGIDCAIFERASTLHSINAGLVIQITVMRALQKLGLRDQILTITGQPFEAIELKTPGGKLLASIPQSPLGKELGTPAFIVHRAEYLHILASQLEGSGIIHLNSDCTGFEQDEDGVTAHFADGHKEYGAVLVGADGIHSVIRTILLGDEPLRYAGYTAWRAMPAFNHPSIDPHILQQGEGRGQIFGIYPAKDKIYWFAGKKTSPGGSDAPQGRKQELLNLFKGWFEPVEALIEATNESDILRNDVYDRKPASRWGNGRVTLMGDAAHPATPTLGQGAGMAIEDAVVLAKELALASGLRDYPAVDNALRAYERERIPRTTDIVNESWEIGRRILWTNPLQCYIRDTFLRLTPRKVWRKSAEAAVAYEP